MTTAALCLGVECSRTVLKSKFGTEVRKGNTGRAGLGELWPVRQIWPVTCFHVAWELKMVFLYFSGAAKKEK